MKLINKDALVAKLRRRIQESIDAGGATSGVYLSERMKEDSYILSFLDTIEVKEVDNKPECKIFPRPIECYSTCKECPWLATDNKAQKGK